MESQKSSNVRRFLYKLGTIATVVALVMLIFEISIAFLMSGPTFVELLDAQWGIYVLAPDVTVIATIGSPWTVAFFLFLFASVIASIAILLGKFFESLKIENGRPVWSSVEESPLAEVAKMASAVLFLTIVTVIVAAAMGMEIGTLDLEGVPGWALSLSFIQASVWEEILCRVCALGLPVLVIAYASGERENMGKYVVGGFGFNKTVLVFLILSSALFGYAHIGGWGLWKFPSTFLFGLGAGYLYCRYGLYASISMHFLIDYATAESIIGINTPFMSLMLLFLFFAGIFFTMEYGAKLVAYAKRAATPEDS